MYMYYYYRYTNLIFGANTFLKLWTDNALYLIYFPFSDTVMYFMWQMCLVLTDMMQNLEVNTGHSLF